MAVKIVYAGYGVWNNTCNATAVVQSQYDTGKRTFTASNEYCGDPMPSERKYLYIVWDNNGVQASGVTGERDARGVVVP